MWIVPENKFFITVLILKTDSHWAHMRTLYSVLGFLNFLKSSFMFNLNHPIIFYCSKNTLFLATMVL